MRISADQQEAAKDIYQELLDAGVKLDHHESDLYAEKTPVSERIVRDYQFKSNVKVFRDQIEHNLWYDIPFAYSPFWAKRGMRGSEKTAGNWLSPIKNCDFCGENLKKSPWFVDGATDQGPWACMCPICFDDHGKGLGMGMGQKFDSRTGRKLEGSINKAAIAKELVKIAKDLLV